MGYSLHITRIGLTTKETAPIALDEWLAYVGSDREMRLLGTARFTSRTGDAIEIKAPGLTEWIESSTGAKVWFDRTTGGTIAVKNPSREARVKMFQVAKALEAVVQGDEGEHYDASGNCLPLHQL